MCAVVPKHIRKYAIEHLDIFNLCLLCQSHLHIEILIDKRSAQHSRATTSIIEITAMNSAACSHHHINVNVEQPATEKMKLFRGTTTY